jgi:ribosome modulation factor
MAERASAAAVAANVDPDVIASCYQEYAELMSERARANAKVSAMLARYEKQGVDKKGIKNAYAISSKDPAEAARQHAKNTEYLMILEIIETDETGQGTFDKALTIKKPSPKSSERVRVARAHADGYNSGKAGGTIESRGGFQPGSEEFVAWSDGWQDGHNDRVAVKPEAEKVTKAEPRKRGNKDVPALTTSDEVAGNA